MKIEYSATTTVGSREYNQDVFLVDETISNLGIDETQHTVSASTLSQHTIKLFVVCDGVGSYKDSGFAAQKALEGIKDFHLKTNPENITDLKAWVIEAIQAGKDAMESYCFEHGLDGSTTIALLAIKGDEYVFANIGDSPAYLLRNDELKELSFKHNMAEYRRLLNEIPAEYEHSILLHHLGEFNLNIPLTAHFDGGKLYHKDAFVICTDGVSNALMVNFIQMLSSKTSSYDFAIKSGEAINSDNCTAITIYVEDLTDES